MSQIQCTLRICRHIKHIQLSQETHYIALAFESKFGAITDYLDMIFQLPSSIEKPYTVYQAEGKIMNHRNRAGLVYVQNVRPLFLAHDPNLTVS